MNKAEAKISYALSKRDEEIQLKVESLVETIESYEVNSIFVRIELSILLVEIKKEKGKDFYNVIVETIFSKKKVHRSMQMVLKSDVDFKEAMKTSGSVKDVAERVKLLEIDKRFLSFKKELDIANIHDLTLTKLEKMKSLSLEKWDKVVSGTDIPYLDMLKEETKNKKEATKKEIASHKPKTMSKVEFGKAVKSGLYPAITSLHEFSIQNTKLEKSVKSLESEIVTLGMKQHEMEVELARFDGMMVVSGNLINQDVKNLNKVKNT